MKRILEKLAGVKNVNLIQFVPLIFVISLVGNSVFGYTEPKVEQPSVTKEVSAESSETEKKSKKVSGGTLNLSKIKDGTYEGTGTGFRGTVKVSVTVKDHKITAIDVLSSADDASFFNRAKSGVIASILSSQSLNVDVVSGATYSSKGIIAAVKNALTGEVDQSSAQGSKSSSGSAAKLSAVKESGTYKDGTYTGSGKGWGGTTTVSVVIKNSKIKSIKVLSNQDTPSYFNKAKSSVISSIIKKQTTNVDAVSGATYSSNGIIKAVRNALSKAKTTKKSSSKKKNTQTSTTENKSLTLSGKHKDGTYQGSGEGYHGGTTTLAVTIKSNRITKIKTVSHEDTPSFFASAKKLFQTIIAKQSTKVDVVSGATLSSNGIIDAVKEALGKAEIKDTDSGKKPSTGDDTDKKDDADQERGIYKDGTYTGNGICQTNDYSFDPYSVQLDVIIQNGRITNIQNFVYGEAYYLDDDEWYMNRAINGTSSKPGMISKIIDKQSTEVDTVSGATCSSRAIIEAVGNALTGAK